MSTIESRRSFLTRVWQAGFGLVAVAGAWTAWDFLWPRRAGGFGGKIRAVPSDQIPVDGVLEVPSAQAYLTKIDGEVKALWWRCPHLGCRVPWCESSGRFECSCHASEFNRAGDQQGGPAPRGMDGFEITIDGDVVVIDTGSVTTGEPVGTVTIDEPARGPSCREAD